MITENLSTLKINKLTQAQYEREKNAGRLDEFALYLTPEKKIAGIIHQYAGANAPDGYVLCDGSYYDTMEYPELFDAIGFTYGEKGSGTNIFFAVPNLATRVPIGVGTGYALGSTGGEAEHTLTVSELPAHDHGAVYTGNAISSNKKYPWFTGTGDKIGYQAIETGSGAAHNNMQPYIALNYIISTGK